MDSPARPGRRTRGNAIIAWVIVVLLGLLTVAQALEGEYRWGVITWGAIGLVAVPAIATRDPRALPPWELIALVAIPVVDAALLGQTVISPIATYLAVAAVALIAAVDIDAYTATRMSPAFVVALVVIATLAVAATWNVSLWVVDLLAGTEYLVDDRGQDAANREMMIDFIYATGAGLFGGAGFAAYLPRGGFRPGHHGGGGEARTSASDETTPSFADRIGLDEPRLRLLSRGLQVGLAGLFLFGLLLRDVPTVTNAGIALGVSFLPALLERNYRIPIEPELVLWLFLAAFLHTLGSAGLYDLLGQWDSLTHALSASIVAAAGYTVVRAIDLHSPEVHLPRELMFAFILLFVLAVGVVWELAEFFLDRLAEGLEMQAALAQHGIDDTIGDFVFNLIGGLAVATVGAAYLQTASEQLAARLDGEV